ncbi:methionyl-tRNA formyltransferase [Candidatus Pelagibacter sp.]|nr:methionyl-tRNA formyltransferase [Candidatus Pelagibacter sp.]
MNFIFIGSGKFGLKCLRTCLKIPNLSLKTILTIPESFNISYNSKPIKNILHVDFKKIANDLSIPLKVLKNSMNDPGLLEEVISLKPKFLIVAGWYHMIPKKWLDKIPAYALHASLLPDYTGGAPLVWAIINGETKTGVTLFKMDNNIDSGPIIDQEECNITNDDTIKTLYTRIEISAVNLLKNSLSKIIRKKINFKIQDNSKRRIFPQRKPEDGLIDWKWRSIEIDRFIRAQTKPYPGAYTILNNSKLHIWKAEIINKKHKLYQPGKISFKNSDYCTIECSNSYIKLLKISYMNHDYSQKNIKNIFKNIKQDKIK